MVAFSTPIALLSTLGKLFTKILTKHLQFDGVTHDLFHPGQFSGISKHATTDVSIILMDIITSNRDRGLHTTILALNIAQFFPLMDHQVIATLLCKLSFNGKILSFISNFLHECSTTYLWDGLASSHSYSCDNGVPQGDPLSPVLSVLYLSLAIKHLFPWGYDRFANSLFFVDDGTLVCSSFSLDDNVAFLTDLYQNFLALLSVVSLTIEQTKLELKHFIAYNACTSQRTFALIRQPPLKYVWKGKEYTVPPAEIWHYLGFFFDSYLKFSHHIHYYTNKGFSTIRAFNMLGNLCSSLGPRQWVMCYNACVVPVLTYRLPLWYALDGKGTLKNFKHMACVQNFAVQWITSCFQGTPIGAMELLSSVPPLQLQCNLLVAGYVAQIMTLPENHLLHRAWQIEPLPGWLCNFVPQSRPAHLPSDNPLTCINALGTVGEQFIEFHKVCRLGDRVIDLHADRFLYLHLDAPHKGSDNFKEWLKGFSCWVAQTEASGAWMIYMDSGFWREQRLGAQASVITRARQVIMEHVEWVLAASSFDAEIAALESAISWLCTHDDMIGTPTIHLLVDNKGVIQSFLKTHVRSSQMSAMHINLLLNLFQQKPDLCVNISYCPCHLGIPFNKHVNCLASSHDDPTSLPQGMLHQHFLEDHLKVANTQWQALSRLESYCSCHWLLIHRKKHPFTPQLKNHDTRLHFINMAGNNMTNFSCLLCAITCHTPIGEYYSSQPDCFPGFPTQCSTCPNVKVQTCAHILTTCPKYVSSFSSLCYLLKKKNNDILFSSFLVDNPLAFSFTDLPPNVH